MPYSHEPWIHFDPMKMIWNERHWKQPIRESKCCSLFSPIIFHFILVRRLREEARAELISGNCCSWAQSYTPVRAQPNREDLKREFLFVSWLCVRSTHVRYSRRRCHGRVNIISPPSPSSSVPLAGVAHKHKFLCRFQFSIFRFALIPDVNKFSVSINKSIQNQSTSTQTFRINKKQT